MVSIFGASGHTAAVARSRRMRWGVRTWQSKDMAQFRKFREVLKM